jgi:hypothetical protein
LKHLKKCISYIANINEAAAATEAAATEAADTETAVTGGAAKAAEAM